jgi:hypothetical protein
MLPRTPRCRTIWTCIVPGSNLPSQIGKGMSQDMPHAFRFSAPRRGFSIKGIETQNNLIGPATALLMSAARIASLQQSPSSDPIGIPGHGWPSLTEFKIPAVVGDHFKQACGHGADPRNRPSLQRAPDHIRHGGWPKLLRDCLL